MPSMLLNEKTVKNLVGSTKNHGKIFYDNKNPGFGLRISKGGTASYILRYRHRGIDRTYKIGNAETWSFTLAKEEARKLKVEIDKGFDPQIERNNQLKSPKMIDCGKSIKNTTNLKTLLTQLRIKVLFGKIISTPH